MTSPDPIPMTLSDQLRQLGLLHTADELNDFLARATQKRWSPVVQLERLVLGLDDELVLLEQQIDVVGLQSVRNGRRPFVVVR